MSRLSESEARSLIELLDLALGRREPLPLIEAAAAGWKPGRLASAASRCASALRAGAPLSEALAESLPAPATAALQAGERRGEPRGGLERCRCVLSRATRLRRQVWAPAFRPLAVLSVAGLSTALLGWLAAAPIQSLRIELAALAGRPEPGGAVAFAAAHPALVASVGAACALLPWLAPLLFAALPRTRIGGELLLRLPVLGGALRLRATADLLESLADLVAGGVPHDEAWALAVESVGPTALRVRLRAMTPAAAAGDPLDELLNAAGLTSSWLAALRPERLRADGGVDALGEVAARADADHERSLALAGRLLVVTSGSLGVAAVAGLLALVLVPLLQAGGL